MRRQGNAGPDVGAAPPVAHGVQPVYAPDVSGTSPHPYGPPDARRFDPVAASIRNQVVDRLLRMNLKHAGHAWAQRRAHPIAPHGLAFLYADQVHPGDDDRPPRYRVAAATRLFDDIAEVRDLAALLYRLTGLARTRYAPAFDPRRHMCNRTDAQMPSHAGYIGVGVSSLDTALGSWEQMQARASGGQDIPGRCLALVSTDTMLLVHRGARDAFDEVEVWSTTDLNVTPHRAARAWAPADPQQMSAVAGLAPVWARLSELHTLTVQQRPAATPSRARARGD